MGEEVEKYVVGEVVNLIHDAKRPVILVDACAIRHRVLPQLNDLIKKTGFPVFTTPMGKSAVDETSKTYGGVYIGSVTEPHIKEIVESADLVLSIGALKSDFNTGSFSYHINKASTIEFHSDYTKLKYATYEAGMVELLPKVTAALDSASMTKIESPIYENKAPEKGDKITHSYFWPTVGLNLLNERDFVVTETGTSNFGILDTKFPAGVTAISQVLWGSIGWSVGALLGVCEAASELDRRVIIFVGDGSLQLTVQELATIIRRGLKPIIFVLNNGGYTIERLINEGKYNNISSWDHRALLSTFGSKDHKTYRVSIQDEVNDLFKDSEFQKAGVVQLVEVMMDTWDAPRALKVQAKLTSESNARKE